jgi:tetratricopeptide (TPR) repeat protein
MTAMADKLMQQGKLTEAEELYRRGIEGREHMLGPDHPETYDIVYNLALLLETRRKFTEAEEHFMHVMNGREKMLGKTHSTTCDVAMSLGSMFNKLARYQKASEMFDLAYRGYLEGSGEGNEKTIKALKYKQEMDAKRASSVCVVC